MSQSRRSDYLVDRGSEIEMEPMLGRERHVALPIHLAKPDVRAGFVRKVYGIVAVQLLVDVLLAGLVVRYGKCILLTHPSLFMSVMALCSMASMVTLLVFSCCPQASRKSPGNYVALAFLTVTQGILTGMVCLKYTHSSVLMCLAITSGVTVALTLYAWAAKSDMTSFGPYLFCALMVLVSTSMLISIVSVCGFANMGLLSGLEVLYAAGAALLFSFFIIYDTQMIMGGTHKHEFTVDDYTVAAISLYLDILQLFLSLLRLVGRQDDGV